MPFHRAIPEQQPPKKTSGGMTAYIEAEKLMQIAFVLPTMVFLGWAAGWWLGNRLHQHWIAIAGILFGCVAGLYYVIQQAMIAEKVSRKEDADQNGNDKGNTDLPS
jgi:uncharacterized membrane protein YfcA